jgi:hypothetical protein
MYIDLKELKAYLSPSSNFAGQIKYGKQSAHLIVSTDAGYIQVSYTTTRPDQGARFESVEIPLVTTPCNYGGQRFWMIAPCCGARVRIVYMGIFLYPACRSCCQLHYESQLATEKERHITREKYLLCNYGYAWAKNEYDMMKEHYYTIEPDIERKKRQSEVQWYLRNTRLLISFNRQMYRLHVREFATIRTMEDRATLLAHYLKEWGREHTLSLLTQFRQTAHPYASQDELDALICIIGSQSEKRPPIAQLSTLLAIKSQFKRELRALERAA